jgi:hypothetical protein
LEFVDQGGFSDSWLTGDKNDLPLPLHSFTKTAVQFVQGRIAALLRKFWAVAGWSAGLSHYWVPGLPWDPQANSTEMVP